MDNVQIKQYTETELRDLRKRGFALATLEQDGKFVGYSLQSYNPEDLKDFPETLVIPDGVIKVETHAFDNVKRLIKTVELPDTCEAIDERAFYGCENLSSINLTGVKNLGVSSFENCFSLEGISLSESGEFCVIPERCFANCRALKNVNLGAAIEVQKQAFFGCEKIENFEGFSLTDFGKIIAKNTGNFSTVPGTIKLSMNNHNAANIEGFNRTDTTIDLVENPTNFALKKINPNIEEELREGGFDFARVFNNAGVVAGYSIVGYHGVQSEDAQISIPEGTTDIAPDAFAGVTAKTISLPFTLCNIGANAFKGSKVKEITGGANVHVIDKGAFYGCKDLEVVPVFNLVESISANCFKGCTGLKEYRLGSATTQIEGGAFSDCYNLFLFQAPMVMDIAEDAFDRKDGIGEPLKFYYSKANLDLRFKENRSYIQTIHSNMGAKEIDPDTGRTVIVPISEIIDNYRAVVKNNALSSSYVNSNLYLTNDGEIKSSLTVGERNNVLDKTISYSKIDEANKLYKGKAQIIFDVKTGKPNFSLLIRVNDVERSIKFNSFTDFYYNCQNRGVQFELDYYKGLANDAGVDSVYWGLKGILAKFPIVNKDGHYVGTGLFPEDAKDNSKGIVCSYHKGDVTETVRFDDIWHIFNAIDDCIQKASKGNSSYRDFANWLNPETLQIVRPKEVESKAKVEQKAEPMVQTTVEQGPVTIINNYNTYQGPVTVESPIQPIPAKEQPFIEPSFKEQVNNVFEFVQKEEQNQNKGEQLNNAESLQKKEREEDETKEYSFTETVVQEGFAFDISNDNNVVVSKNGNILFEVNPYSKVSYSENGIVSRVDTNDGKRTWIYNEDGSIAEYTYRLNNHVVGKSVFSYNESGAIELCKYSVEIDGRVVKNDSFTLDSKNRLSVKDNDSPVENSELFTIISSYDLNSQERELYNLPEIKEEGEYLYLLKNTGRNFEYVGEKGRVSIAAENNIEELNNAVATLQNLATDFVANGNSPMFVPVATLKGKQNNENVLNAYRRSAVKGNFFLERYNELYTEKTSAQYLNNTGSIVNDIQNSRVVKYVPISNDWVSKESSCVYIPLNIGTGSDKYFVEVPFVNKNGFSIRRLQENSLEVAKDEILSVVKIDENNKKTVCGISGKQVIQKLNDLQSSAMEIPLKWETLYTNIRKLKLFENDPLIYIKQSSFENAYSTPDMKGLVSENEIKINMMTRSKDRAYLIIDPKKEGSTAYYYNNNSVTQYEIKNGSCKAVCRFERDEMGDDTLYNTTVKDGRRILNKVYEGSDNIKVYSYKNYKVTNKELSDTVILTTVKDELKDSYYNTIYIKKGGTFVAEKDFSDYYALSEIDDSNYEIVQLENIDGKYKVTPKYKIQGEEVNKKAGFIYTVKDLANGTVKKINSKSRLNTADLKRLASNAPLDSYFSVETLYNIVAAQEEKNTAGQNKPKQYREEQKEYEDVYASLLKNYVDTVDKVVSNVKDKFASYSSKKTILNSGNNSAICEAIKSLNKDELEHRRETSENNDLLESVDNYSYNGKTIISISEISSSKSYSLKTEDGYKNLPKVYSKTCYYHPITGELLRTEFFSAKGLKKSLLASVDGPTAYEIVATNDLIKENKEVKFDVKLESSANVSINETEIATNDADFTSTYTIVESLGIHSVYTVALDKSNHYALTKVKNPLLGKNEYQNRTFAEDAVKRLEGNYVDEEELVALINKANAEYDEKVSVLTHDGQSEVFSEEDGSRLIGYIPNSELVIIGGRVESIATGAIANEYITSIKIGSGVKNIEPNAIDCSNLREIEVDKNNKRYVAFSGLLYERTGDGLKLLLVPAKISGQKIVLHNECTSIEETAFDWIDSKTTQIEGPFHLIEEMKNEFPSYQYSVSTSYRYSGADGIVFDANEKSVSAFAYEKIKEPFSINIGPEVTSLESIQNENLVRYSVDISNKKYYTDRNGLLFERTSPPRLISCPSGAARNNNLIRLPDGCIVSLDAFAGCNDKVIVTGEGLSNSSKVNINKSNSVRFIDADNIIKNDDFICVVNSDDDTCSVIKCISNKEKVELQECNGYPITSVLDYAFDKNEICKEIVISEVVNEIQDNAFEGCTALETIAVNEKNGNYYSEQGVLYNKAKNILIRCPQKLAATEFEINPKVSYINPSAFNGTSLRINASSINSSYMFKDVQFEDSNSLVYGNNGKALVYYPKNNSQDEFVIKENLNYISPNALANLRGRNIVSESKRFVVENGLLYLRDSVEEGSNYTLLSCFNNNEDTIIEISDKCSCINEGAFAGRNRLTTIVIPKNCGIGKDAFKGCYNLKNIMTSGLNAESVKSSVINSIGEQPQKMEFPNFFPEVGKAYYDLVVDLNECLNSGAVNPLSAYHNEQSNEKIFILNPLFADNNPGMHRYVQDCICPVLSCVAGLPYDGRINYSLFSQNKDPKYNADNYENGIREINDCFNLTPQVRNKAKDLLDKLMPFYYRKDYEYKKAKLISSNYRYSGLDFTRLPADNPARVLFDVDRLYSKLGTNWSNAVLENWKNKNLYLEGDEYKNYRLVYTDREGHSAYMALTSQKGISPSTSIENPNNMIRTNGSFSKAPIGSDVLNDQDAKDVYLVDTLLDYMCVTGCGGEAILLHSKSIKGEPNDITKAAQYICENKNAKNKNFILGFKPTSNDEKNAVKLLNKVKTSAVLKNGDDHLYKAWNKDELNTVHSLREEINKQGAFSKQENLPVNSTYAYNDDRLRERIERAKANGENIFIVLDTETTGFPEQSGNSNKGDKVMYQNNRMGEDGHAHFYNLNDQILSASVHLNISGEDYLLFKGYYRPETTENGAYIKITDEFGNEIAGLNENYENIQDAVSVWLEAAKINGIYPEDVKYLQPFSKDVSYLQELLGTTLHGVTITGYNLPFDIRMLRRYGFEVDNPCVDLLAIARQNNFGSMYSDGKMHYHQSEAARCIIDKYGDSIFNNDEHKKTILNALNNAHDADADTTVASFLVTAYKKLGLIKESHYSEPADESFYKTEKILQEVGYPRRKEAIYLPKSAVTSMIEHAIANGRTNDLPTFTYIIPNGQDENDNQTRTVKYNTIDFKDIVNVDKRKAETDALIKGSEYLVVRIKDFFSLSQKEENNPYVNWIMKNIDDNVSEDIKMPLDSKIEFSNGTLFLGKEVKSVNDEWFKENKIENIVVDPENKFFVYENGALFSAKDGIPKYSSVPAYVSNVEQYTKFMNETFKGTVERPDLSKIDTNGMIFDSRGKLISFSSELCGEHLVVPEYCTGIASNAIHGVVKSLTILGDKREFVVEKDAFARQEKLSIIKGANIISHIKDGAFKDCVSLSGELNLMNCEFVGDNAFNNTGIQSVKINGASLGEYCFANNRNLKDIFVEDSPASLKKGVFENCYSLDNIPNGLIKDTIPKRAFRGCVNLQELNLKEVIIEEDAFAYSGVKRVQLENCKVRKNSFGGELEVIEISGGSVSKDSFECREVSNKPVHVITSKEFGSSKIDFKGRPVRIWEKVDRNGRSMIIPETKIMAERLLKPMRAVYKSFACGEEQIEKNINNLRRMVERADNDSDKLLYNTAIDLRRYLETERAGDAAINKSEIVEGVNGYLKEYLPENIFSDYMSYYNREKGLSKPTKVLENQLSFFSEPEVDKRTSEKTEFLDSFESALKTVGYNGTRFQEIRLHDKLSYALQHDDVNAFAPYIKALMKMSMLNPDIREFAEVCLPAFKGLYPSKMEEINRWIISGKKSARHNVFISTGSKFLKNKNLLSPLVSSENNTREFEVAINDKISIRIPDNDIFVLKEDGEFSRLSDYTLINGVPENIKDVVVLLNRNSSYTLNEGGKLTRIGEEGESYLDYFSECGNRVYESYSIENPLINSVSEEPISDTLKRISVKLLNASENDIENSSIEEPSFSEELTAEETNDLSLSNNESDNENRLEGEFEAENDNQVDKIQNEQSETNASQDEVVEELESDEEEPLEEEPNDQEFDDEEEFEADEYDEYEEFEDDDGIFVPDDEDEGFDEYSANTEDEEPSNDVAAEEDEEGESVLVVNDEDTDFEEYDEESSNDVAVDEDEKVEENPEPESTNEDVVYNPSYEKNDKASENENSLTITNALILAITFKSALKASNLRSVNGELNPDIAQSFVKFFGQDKVSQTFGRGVSLVKYNGNDKDLRYMFSPKDKKLSEHFMVITPTKDSEQFDVTFCMLVDPEKAKEIQSKTVATNNIAVKIMGKDEYDDFKKLFPDPSIDDANNYEDLLVLFGKTTISKTELEKLTKNIFNSSAAANSISNGISASSYAQIKTPTTPSVPGGIPKGNQAEMQLSGTPNGDGEI